MVKHHYLIEVPRLGFLHCHIYLYNIWHLHWGLSNNWCWQVWVGAVQWRWAWPRAAFDYVGRT